MKRLEDYLYYEEKNPSLKIYCGDCLEILPLLQKVDLVVADPPYGLGDRLSGGNWGKRVGKAAAWDNIFKEIERIVSSGNDAIIWGGNYYQLPLARCWLGWIKRDAVRTCASLDLAWTSFDRPAKYYDCTIADTNAERNEHPTIKPLKLMRWCLSFAEGSVLDPFLGSGTTLVACKELNRNGIGIEINEKYCEIAKKRLEATRKPLFTDVNGAGKSTKENETQNATLFDVA